jgi:hypothetical protein
MAINGDGNPDVAFADGNTGIYVLLGNGGGTFQFAAQYSPSAGLGEVK